MLQIALVANDISPHSHTHSPSLLLALRLLSLGATLFFFLPGRFFGNTGSGLDPSWQIALHRAFDGGLVFGRDFVFTYGPLGWLSTRLPYPGTRDLLLYFDITLLICSLLALWLVVQRLTRWHQFLVPPVIAWCAGSPFLAHNTVMFVFALEVVFLIEFVRVRNWFYLAPAALLAVIAFFVKLNMGFVGLGAYLLALVFGVAGHKGALPHALVGVVSLAVVLSLGVLACNVDLLGYVKGSFEIAKGYNEAMMIPPVGREEYLVLALVTLTVFALWLLYNARRLLSDRVAFFASIVSSLFIFLIFKQSYVRADEHVFEFVAWSAAPVALCAWAALPIARFVWLPMLVAVSPAIYFEGRERLSVQYLTFRAEGISTYFTEVKDRAQIAEREPLPSANHLPQDLVAKIGNSTVDIIPWEISELVVNKLNYHPRPVMQSYSAYTPYLDSINGDFFRSDNRPRFVVYAHHCADGRFCNFDDSSTRLALLTHYDVVGRWPYILLLEARAVPRKMVESPGPQASLQFGRGFDVPQSDGVLLVNIDLAFTPLGKLLSTLYQPAAVEVLFFVGKDKSQPYRAVPPILRGGVILNQFVENIDDAERLFRHLPPARSVTKIRFVSNNPHLYKKTVSLSSKVIRFEESQ